MTSPSKPEHQNGRGADRTVLLAKDGTPSSIRVRKYKLLVVSGPNQGQEVVIDREVFAIGASRENDLVVDDQASSRRHCEIQTTPEGFLIRDLNSTNGTIMYSVRICEAYLKHGAEFQIGNTRLVFCPLQETVSYPLSPRESFGRLLGRSVPMRKVFHLAETFAASDAAVLIEGETGTGKELLAEAMHQHSPRRDRPFVVIDCGSLARGVIESELFGHAKGAFTGAAAERIGAFEQAHGGTVLLDEIGELDLELQPKLLRVLERKDVRRVGSNQVRRTDVRVLTATNRKLQQELNGGHFREDLFYRISTVRIELPPLRQRREDIPLLVRHFLKEFSGGQEPDTGPEFERTLELFNHYEWPGNVRELRNLVEMSFHGRMGRLDLGSCLYLARMKEQPGAPVPVFASDAPFKTAKGRLVDQFELEYVRALLDRNRGNVSRAAREAQIERAYLQRLIRKHGLKN